MASVMEQSDDLVLVGDEAYTTAEWAALESRKARKAAYRARPEVKAREAAYRARPERKAREAAYQAEMRYLARLAREAGLG